MCSYTRRSFENQKDAEEDLKNAEPLVLQAMAALETLDKKEIGECKTMAKPPKGVDDVFAAIMVLVAGIMKNVPVQKMGKSKIEVGMLPRKVYSQISTAF